jgi:beta-glucosidase
MKTRVSILLILVVVSSAWYTQTADTQKRIDALLTQMTLEEKLGQMSQAALSGALTEKTKDEIRKGRWGSFLNSGTAAEKAEAQRIATKESRLHIPLIFGQDVIHGYQTIFPIPLGQAASWDAGLVSQAARVAAREASSAGIHWTFAPMLDIARDARWGRIAEGLGEDPHLGAVLGAAMVHGFQGESISARDSIAACAKHYVGYGAAEGGRDYNTTWIPENLLREVYLPPFRAAREAGVATLMSGFNDLNGVPASGNEFTLRQILRNEWKFTGFVVSDYTSIVEMIPHGYAADAGDAALKAIRAGVDMEMVSTSYWDRVKSLVDSGKLDIALVNGAVRNILRVKFALGLFDRREQPVPPSDMTPSADALDTARKLATESLVVLKNRDSALPLSKSIGKLAIIGPLADSQADQMGTWSMNGLVTAVRTPLAALREALGPSRIASASGLKNSQDMSHDGFAAALDAARSADVVLLFLGEEAILSGEASSRTKLNLPGAQEELVREVSQSGKPLIAVIMAGRPLTFHAVAEASAAVLYAWHPGTMGGPAIADVILGSANPSGKIAVTFPRTVGQLPLYYNHMNTGRPAAETGPESRNKYTSKYLDSSFTPEYPFGFGISYSKFNYSNVRLSGTEVRLGGKLTVSAEISNDGSREGDEIVQFYTHQLAASMTRPVRELRDFRRISLKPGQRQTVQFTLSTDDLAFYNARMQLITEAGDFEAWVAPDSASSQAVRFRVVR